ncbi:MAG TPA: methionyl-tRNA formyltransferase [Caldimonas sp.]|nr:methionyl-tRNA formyltransferase [Caldimonas sp.]HEV7576731.1 methionyl-tRNA formyltransferase [Caldimonas sp.]
MRLAFAGTPEFARVALARLHGAGLEVALVLSQPDRPAGRGMKLAPSPVKAFALEHRIAVAQPRGLRLDGKFADDAAAARDALVAGAPDAIVVAAYGLILPPWLLALPRLGCINVHASLLPRWRGAAPIQRAIEAGDDITGVTIMEMDAGLDTGPMLGAETLEIGAGESAGALQTRLAALGGELVVETLGALAKAPLVGRPQPAAGATYAAKITKAEATIDWRAPAAEIERRLRAFDPVPGARSVLAGATITCWRGDVRPGGGAPGEVVVVEDGALVVACGEGRLALTELQRAGGRRMGAEALLRGWKPAVGAVFDAAPGPTSAAVAD